mmetsp:Transcript_21840/g.37153  ORF Transcript_21840/g.37153 Transcript_21840/m.37153 type:complete len:115 (-) Transcript_21840:181-525(-)
MTSSPSQGMAQSSKEEKGKESRSVERIASQCILRSFNKVEPLPPHFFLSSKFGPRQHDVNTCSFPDLYMQNESGQRSICLPPWIMFIGTIYLPRYDEMLSVSPRELKYRHGTMR